MAQTHETLDTTLDRQSRKHPNHVFVFVTDRKATTKYAISEKATLASLLMAIRSRQKFSASEGFCLEVLDAEGKSHLMPSTTPMAEVRAEYGDGTKYGLVQVCVRPENTFG